MGNAITPENAYPTAEQVLNRARSIVNDAFRGGKGRILTDNAAFTIEFLNGAFEDLQNKLSNYGSITFIKDNVILGPITPVAISPGAQIFISYSGFFNGTDNVAVPKLPSDLRAIETLRERQIGSNLPFAPMRQTPSGLPSVYQGQWLKYWEWRTDRLYMVGSTTTEELQIRYECLFPSFSDPSDFANTQISILASTEALATMLAYRYARARGAQGAAILKADATEYQRDLIKRYVRQAQGVTYHRPPYGGYPEAGNNEGNNSGNLPM